MISPDPLRRFELEVLRTPSGARVTWQRHDCDRISDRSKPEMFVLHLGCSIVETGWQAVWPFLLAAHSPSSRSS